MRRRIGMLLVIAQIFVMLFSTNSYADERMENIEEVLRKNIIVLRDLKTDRVVGDIVIVPEKMNVSQIQKAEKLILEKGINALKIQQINDVFGTFDEKRFDGYNYYIKVEVNEIPIEESKELPDYGKGTKTYN